MRLFLVLAWALVVLAVLWPFVRRLLRASPGPRRAVLPDQLVKDPVCRVYLLRSRAIRSELHGEPVYFCSAECARQFERSGA
jgi:YHS domain-containing protein